MTDFLDRLVDGARRRVEDARRHVSFTDLRSAIEQNPRAASFHDALAAPGVRVIAEVKRASPSKGDLAPDLSASEQAGQYLAGGAAAVSVLTEPAEFKGSLRDLKDASAVGLPTIRKDFIVDEYQIWEAKAHGAAAVLLIVAALDDERLQRLLQVVGEANLDALVEVHDERELERAGNVGARIIGVNARNLRSFEIDREAFERLRPLYPEGALAVAESGVRGPDDVRRAAAQGADAVLVGETLVLAHDPKRVTALLVRAGQEGTVT